MVKTTHFDPSLRTSRRSTRGIIGRHGLPTGIAEERHRAKDQSMTERHPPDEAAFAAVLASDDVSRITIEDGWAATHARLMEVFPGCAFELRAGPYVFGGGYDFGTDRHLLAVLGGKGGVGKSTTALNLAAMGHRVGLVDGDLRACPKSRGRVE
jgi:Mrp family chromosome partitioning ATPase